MDNHCNTRKDMLYYEQAMLRMITAKSNGSPPALRQILGAMMEDISDQELLKIQSKEIQRLRRQHAELQEQQELTLCYLLLGLAAMILIASYKF